MALSCVETQSAFKQKLVVLTIDAGDYFDPKIFLENCSNLFNENVKNYLVNHNMIKVNLVLTADFERKSKDKIIEETFFMGTRLSIIDQVTNFKSWYKKNIEELLKKIEEFQKQGSGWSLASLKNLIININKYEPLKGSSYISLPRFIQDKKAVINVQNDFDEFCFKWSVLSALYPVKKNAHRVTNYQKFENKLDFSGISFPVSLNQISKFEKQNELSINVYIIEENNDIVPILLTKMERSKRHIHLLLLKEDENTHYCWIKNLSRLVSSQISKNGHALNICDRCLNYFSGTRQLRDHSINCRNQNNSKIVMPNEEDKWIKFKNFNFKEKVPFIIYADIESILECIDGQSGKTTEYQKHIPFSVGYYFHCEFDSTKSYYREHCGHDCIDWFLSELLKISEMVSKKLKNIVPMEENSMDETYFINSTECHICEKPFNHKSKKVRDHCHLTGKYRGAAHEECNYQYQDSRIIPIVFHNLSGYDAHFIIQKLGSAFKGDISILPLSKERYISFTKTVSKSNFDKKNQSEKMKNIKLRFIDSFRFMADSLDRLLSYIPHENLKILKTEFTKHKQFLLVTRKGVFPYDYINSEEKLQETSLPSIENFYSKLTDCNISDEDFNHAQNVWKTFKIKNLSEYAMLYMKTDILALADVFENFRSSCKNIYGLDPAHYYTAPGYTWDAMLKHTKIKIELLTDIDQLMFIERGIRGGVSQCSGRYCKANNKYVDSFDDTEPSTYLMYLDVNNLYGHAMSQYLPLDGFKWCDILDIETILKIPNDSKTGYILEVDLEYPQNLHDLHSDYPFCPEHKTPPQSKESKLLLTLENKFNYVIHYQNLKQAISNGLKLTKIHRILEFNQSPWLKPYIDLNTLLRINASNEFEKNLYKLMNNAVFGKTMENIRKHVNLKLVSSWEGRCGARKLIANPNFKRRTIFNENLVAIELLKSQIKLNKPIAIGMTILDISKITMYEFNYTYMLAKFSRKNVNLLYTDTDSFVYCIECDDFYDFIKNDIEKFDTSDYPANNKFDIPLKNKKILGLMKDENNGCIMTEFVGLRSKMYAVKVNTKDTIKKVKGVKNYIVKKKLTFDHFTNCLKNKSDIRKNQNSIKSNLHNVYSITQNKIVLSSHDDKRFILKDGINTLPWGHYKIDEENVV